MNKNIIKKIRLFLDTDETQHLYFKAEDTEDLETLLFLLQRAKKIYASVLSETDMMINELNSKL